MAAEFPLRGMCAGRGRWLQTSAARLRRAHRGGKFADADFGVGGVPGVNCLDATQLDSRGASRAAVRAGLVGAAHAGGGAAGFGDGTNKFAARLGGGVDVPVSRHFSVRGQVDYYATTLRTPRTITRIIC